MVRLPQPGGDDGVWGSILNAFLSVAHNDDGTLRPVAQSNVTNLVSDLATTEKTANKGQVGGYPALDGNGGLSVVSRVMRVGPTDYPYTASLSGGGPNSGYVIADKANTASDASLLLRDQGNIRAEIGLAGDNDIHFKTVTGASGSEVFTDRLIIQASGEGWFTSRLGVGTVPAEPLHVALSSSGGRALVKVENTNAGVGSRGVAVQFAGTGVDWAMGTDAGLNGGNNFFIQDNAAGYPPRVLVDGSGNVGIGTDSPDHKLDVAGGDIAATTAGNGFRIAEGANARMGVVTLTAGTVAVNTTAVTANSRIFLTVQSPGGTVGTPYVSARTAGVSFTVTSTSGTDTSVVAWILIEPS